MKFLYILLYSIGILCVSSCKKENSVDEEVTGLYPIKINAKAFVQEITSMSNMQAIASEGNDLRQHIKYFYYFLYADGKPVEEMKMVEQDSTDENFGVITDSVAAGKYTIGLLGSQVPIELNTDDRWLGRYTGVTFSDREGGGGDTFGKSFDLVVSEEINQTVVLERIISKVEVNIVDKVPLEAESFDIYIQNFANYYNVFSGKMLWDGNSDYQRKYILKESEKGVVNLKVVTYLFDTESFTLEHVSFSYPPLGGSKNLPNVKIAPSKITSISGNMGYGSNSGLEAVINDVEWDRDTIFHYF